MNEPREFLRPLGQPHEQVRVGRNKLRAVTAIASPRATRSGIRKHFVRASFILPLRKAIARDEQSESGRVASATDLR